MKNIILGSALLLLSFATGASGIFYYVKHLPEADARCNMHTTSEKSKPQIQSSNSKQKKHASQRLNNLNPPKKNTQKNNIISVTSLKQNTQNTNASDTKKQNNSQKTNSTKTGENSENQKNVNSTKTGENSENQKIKNQKPKKSFFVLFFSKNSNRISSKYKQKLFDFSKGYSDSKFKVYLRTADLDSKSKNKRLGRKRYESIVEIMEKAGIDKGNIKYYVRVPKEKDNPEKLKTRHWRRAVVKVLKNK